MKKRFVLFALSIFCLSFLFAFGVCAATTNEFGEVETSEIIDLTGMSTDTSARVVLFDGTEYHTYPSQYIVKSAGDMALDFSKINAAFEGKSYSANSVVRFEVPNTVTTYTSILNGTKTSMLVEVYFPSDSRVTTLSWGCFENCKVLQKANIPASVTTFNGHNHFASCPSLKEVTFEDGIQIESLPNNFFLKCESLEHIVLPNSLKSAGGNLFGTCKSLKTINFGANFQWMTGPVSDSSSGQTWFISANFYGKDVDVEPTSTLLHWQGAENNNLSGTNHGPSKITFVYTGTKEEALALMARCKAADALNGENCIGLSELYDAILCTPSEYEELTGSKIGEGTTLGNYFVYGYNECDAFYNGEHDTSDARNMFEGKEYLSPYKTYEVCTVCSELKEKATICGALFTYKGYSTDGESIYFDIDIHGEEIALYNMATSSTLKYGIVVSPISNNGVLLDETGGAINKGVIVTSIERTDLVKLNSKIFNIATTLKATPIHFCAYVADNKKVKYIYDTQDDEGNVVANAFDKANQISYSELSES